MRFEVGDKVEVISCDVPDEQSFIGMQGSVMAVGNWKRGDKLRGGECRCLSGEVVVQLVGYPCENLWHEHELKKLPPDSHAADTTEDPGVTRLKKLLQEDVVKVKRPVKA